MIIYLNLKEKRSKKKKEKKDVKTKWDIFTDETFHVTFFHHSIGVFFTFVFLR